MKSKLFKGFFAVMLAAVISVGTAVALPQPPVGSQTARPSHSMLRTDYERQQQKLPLHQRDKLVAEPGLLAIVIVLIIYFFFKIRRDMRISKEQDEEYRRMQAAAEELERQEAQEAAKTSGLATAENEAAAIDVESTPVDEPAADERDEQK